MNKFKFLPVLFAAIACVSGCGESKEEDNPNVVQFWHTFGKTTQDALDVVCKEFHNIMAEHGVDVTIKPSYQGGYDDIARKIREGFAAGNTPTMAVSYQDSVADYLYPENGKYVYNLEDYFNDPNIGFGTQPYLNECTSIDDYVEAFIEEGRSFTKEGTYTLPFMKSTEALFYNKSYLTDAYRLVFDNPQATDAQAESWIKSVPWEEFMSFCESLAPKMKQVNDKLECILYYDSDANLLISKMYQEGIPYSSIKNGKGYIDFQDEPAKSELNSYVTELKRLHDASVLYTKGSNDGKYGSDFFTTYKCLFTVGSTGGTGYNDPGTVFTPGVCKVPASNNNPKYVSQGPSLTFLKNGKYSDERNNHLMELAFQFVKYLTNPEKNTYMCVYGSEGYFPVCYGAYDTPAFVAALKARSLTATTYNVIVSDIQGKYLSTPVFSGSSWLRDEMEGIVKNVLTNTKTVANAINDAISQTNMHIK